MNEYGYIDRRLKRQVDKWMNGWVIKCINRWLRITLQSAFINSILMLLNASRDFSLRCHLKLNLYKHELHPSWFLISFSDKDNSTTIFPRVPLHWSSDWLIQSMILVCLLVCLFSLAICFVSNTAQEQKGGNASGVQWTVGYYMRAAC